MNLAKLATAVPLAAVLLSGEPAPAEVAVSPPTVAATTRGGDRHVDPPQASSAPDHWLSIIVVDSTGSFQHWLPAATKIAWERIRRIALTRVHDEVVVIQVNFAPREAAYFQGVRSQREGRALFGQAFSHVTEGLGTDWHTALVQAAEAMQRARRARIDLQIYGDLIVDQPGPSAGARPAFRSLAEFDWRSLAAAERVRADFVDPHVRGQLLANPAFASLHPEVHIPEESLVTAGQEPLPEAIVPASGAAGSGEAWYWLAGVVGLVSLLALGRPRQGR